MPAHGDNGRLTTGQWCLCERRKPRCARLGESSVGPTSAGRTRRGTGRGAKVLCSEVTCPRPETVVVVVVEGQR